MIIRFFVANTSKELLFVLPLIQELRSLSNENIILQEKISSTNWKEKVEKKVKRSDFFVVMIGDNTLKNSNIKWEIEQAKKQGVSICGLKLSNFKETLEVENFQNDYPLFDSCENLQKFITSEIIEIRKANLESYKLFVGSTEKVTDQRSKIHTLFFTLLASLMTLSFLIANSTKFNALGITVVFFIIIIALFLVYSWEKLVESYGLLNAAKFEIIYKIESRLGINHFEHEWDILQNKLKYKSTTVVEKQFIKIFKIFLSTMFIACVIYFILDAYKTKSLTKEKHESPSFIHKS